MCARPTACFDIGYKVSDICDDEGDTAHCSCYLFQRCSRRLYVYNGCLAWCDVFLNPRYHSSVEWLIADVTDASTLQQLSVFHAWVIVRLTLRYTTPDIRCRDRHDECDGGIISTTIWSLCGGFARSKMLGGHVEAKCGLWRKKIVGKSNKSTDGQYGINAGTTQT